MNKTCLVCKEKTTALPTEVDLSCTICGDICVDDISCEKGHYVCERCRSNIAEAAARELLLTTESTDPVVILNALMRLPSIYMHGPDQHYLVAGALLAAYKNAGGLVDDFPAALDDVIERAREVPGGACGYLGCCGSATGAASTVSVVAGIDPHSEGAPWGTPMALTARILLRMSDIGGPRCCKRNGYISILEAAGYIREKLGVALDPSTPICSFFADNEECIATRCPFFPKNIKKDEEQK